MNKHNIEDLITLDLQTFINLKMKNDTISIDDVLEISAYVAANFMRIIFTRNKQIEDQEINGIFGIISNFFNSYFEGQISETDFKIMTEKSSQLLQNTNFDEMSKAFFNQIIDQEKK